MQENYLISIVGKQQLDNETGEIKLTTLGSYVTKGTSRFIVYKEYDSENNNASTNSILKIEENRRVTLMRGGANHTHLILEKGVRHLCQYDTGYGDMVVGIFTSTVQSNLGEKGGNLKLNYTLDINSSLSSMNEIFITVKEAENKDVKISTAGN